MMCSQCKKNYAIVFISKIVEGKQIQEGLCLSCAKERGIKPIDQLIEQTGISEEELDDINKQVGSLFDNMDLETLNMSQPSKNTDNNDNYLLNFLNSAFSNADQNLNNTNKEKNYEEIKDKKNNTRVKTQEKKSRKKKQLDTYGINLTNMALNDKIDRVVGRNNEIERVIQILNRRRKNNPVLIGESGVGKTAIAEGLALKIVEKQVPAKLLNCEIYLLDLTAIVAGTQFRGQFEGRMRSIIEEAKSLENIILVIDELHNIMGAGEAEGAMNAANILKPALAKGEIQVLGATTLDEYKRHIEKNSALERRFQPVIVDEPSVKETIEILRGVKSYYEDYHKVEITDEAIEAAVYFSERYITDRFLPDKAIDVIDEAGSKANLKNEALVEYEILKDELQRVQKEKESAISADSIEDYQKAADYKVHECKLLQKLKEFKRKYKDIEITVDDVACVIESWTKIPVQRITEIETEKLINLEQRLHKRVIGQDEAVKGVSRAIRRNRTGFRKKKKPASFIFIGPTGVGKTELVRALAEELFECEDSMIRLDMSEYMEKHSVSKIIGSPPGYIGYDEGGQLTEKIRRKPYSVILLDEIEKAHPDIFNVLLQILEDGRITDSHGRVVYFENTVIIMTSNAGTKHKSSEIGFGTENYVSIKSRLTDILKETFRPEFINRVDEIIAFTELNKKELKQIVDIMIKEVEEEVVAKGMTIKVTDSAKEFLIEKGFNIKYGARPIRRTIQRYIEDEISDMYLRGELKEGSVINIDCKKDEIIIKEEK